MTGKELILKYALQNAVFYGGKANAGAVMGKVLSENPGLKKDIAKLGKEIAEAVKAVNKLKPAEQKEKLAAMDSSMLERKEKVQEPLPPLEGAKEGGIVTRFAPAPSGPLHILHLLRALGLSYEYARKYKGKFLVRLEDTDPKKVDKDAYKWIEDDLKSLGYDWDSWSRESDDMGQYYTIAEKLLKDGAFYVCGCHPDAFKKLKVDRQDCPCRGLGGKENLARWKEMLGGREGFAVRMKTGMDDPNPAMRDPPMLRVDNTPHALTGKKFHVWPLYNFANVIEDHGQGITHVFRGKEHEHNTAIQSALYDALGWKQPVSVNFGMLKLPEGKMHKRDMRAKLGEGKLSGWDDPSLPTIRALLRRGYKPEALRMAPFHAGLSKTDIEFNMESLNADNRKLADPTANRYMAVFGPMKLEIGNLHTDRVMMPVHPDYPDKGERTVPVNPKAIYLSESDFRQFNGKVVRLKGLCNIKVAPSARFIDNEPRKELQKLHWVSEPNVKVTLVKPDGREEGIGEPELQKAKAGDIIQLERVGFCRVDSVARGKVTLFFAHK